jgi:hypothetical protein
MKRYALIWLLLLCSCDGKNKSSYAVMKTESPLYFSNMSTAQYDYNGELVKLNIKARSTVKIIGYMPATLNHEKMAKVLIKGKNGEFEKSYEFYVPVSTLDY